MTVTVMVTAAQELAALLGSGRAVALTGAGISTDSGIPDYRGPDSPRRTPMTITEFSSGKQARQRYWARSHVGYARMTRALPNDGHLAMADLERLGAIRGLITQNVDDLHRAAGSQNVIDLHGRIADVICLDCAARTHRYELQDRLAELNPGFVERVGAAIETAPDGDAVLADVAGFRIADCTACGGRLKPDVVFFGENVPRGRVEAAFDLVDHADLLLVAGSSLTVMSGLRFVRRARLRRDIPVVIINRGPTRCDEFATLLIDGGCSEVLTALADTVVQCTPKPSGSSSLARPPDAQSNRARPQ
ncbi:MAG: NAD-dependent protein deacetylase [Geodermatophilaceae bacterium]